MTEQVRGMSLFLVWCHKLLCMHVYKDIIWCKSVCDIKPGIDPCPLLARSWDRWWLDFVTFTAYKKSRFSLKRHSTFWTGAKIYLSQKSILGLGALQVKTNLLFILVWVIDYSLTKRKGNRAKIWMTKKWGFITWYATMIQDNSVQCITK